MYKKIFCLIFIMTFFNNVSAALENSPKQLPDKVGTVVPSSTNPISFNEEQKKLINETANDILGILPEPIKQKLDSTIKKTSIADTLEQGLNFLSKTFNVHITTEQIMKYIKNIPGILSLLEMGLKKESVTK